MEEDSVKKREINIRRVVEGRCNGSFIINSLTTFSKRRNSAR
jgi:hypothetical protein